MHGCAEYTEQLKHALLQAELTCTDRAAGRVVPLRPLDACMVMAVYAITD